MKRLAVLVIALWVTLCGKVWAVEANPMARLHGGNIVQSISVAANENNGYFKTPIENAKIKALESAVISIEMEPSKKIITKSGKDVTPLTTSHIALSKDTGKVKEIVFLVQWNKNAASAMDAFLAAGFVTKLMGKLINPEVKEDGLHKLYKALLGDNPGDFLDGKERVARVNGVKCAAQLVPNVGLGLLMSNGTE
ncbi:hypothetical protein DesfrDRAFT_1186 [Solidesulfovibrio fructosivorans JJ]]|uniref:Uncharacterized protein n=1 Tax=Solidesulfovibrio fructosivorans JJ] TaxID=596151 RepID=E1JU87_SOLFR|nr:hypothetical protein [Solidesulfovibrio fructosivorans]EFL52017.1 hypothetical protein DesfrDRAFT_1186 [Solidesulfovibrio fructosivorans JJ]]